MSWDGVAVSTSMISVGSVYVYGILDILCLVIIHYWNGEQILVENGHSWGDFMVCCPHDHSAVELGLY